MKDEEKHSAFSFFNIGKKYGRILAIKWNLASFNFSSFRPRCHWWFGRNVKFCTKKGFDITVGAEEKSLSRIKSGYYSGLPLGSPPKITWRILFLEGVAYQQMFSGIKKFCKGGWGGPPNSVRGILSKKKKTQLLAKNLFLWSRTDIFEPAIVVDTRDGVIYEGGERICPFSLHPKKFTDGLYLGTTSCCKK